MKGMKGKRIIIPLVAVAMVFAAVGSALARSPYVPNYFSYDPDWKGDLPKIGGYVDAYLTYSQQSDPQYNGLDARKTQFTVDRAELYIQHRATDWADGYFEFSVTGISNDTEINLDEAWLRVVLPVGNGITVLGGVYDVPIGIGANENIDIWNWQYKMVNLLVAPWSFTGGMIEYEVQDININFWIGNDWGRPEAYLFERTGRVNPDTEMTIGGRVGWSPNEKFDVGISAVWGNERLPTTVQGVTIEDPDAIQPGDFLPVESKTTYGPWQSRTMFDLDFRWLDLPDWLGTAACELWWMELTDQAQVGGGVGDSQAYGAVIQFNYQTVWDVLSISLGYEYLHEEDGIVFGNNPNTGIAVNHQTRQSVEVTPIFTIGDHVIMALSYRTDWSSKDVFVNHDGNPTDFAWLGAWEWYYYF